MRLPFSLLIPALCWSARLTSAVQVYNFDPESLPRGDAERSSRTLTPTEARLVLAQRAGVEDYHLDALLTPGGIDAINDFGWRELLFSEHGAPTKRCIILMEVEDEVRCE